jgi:CheY-like chemotaxis protein
VLESGLAVNDPLREIASEIGRAGARAALLTRQLLAFSRRQVMTARVLDLNGLVDNLATMLRRIIGEDIDLRVDAAPTDVFIKADSAQLEQALMNLALNARDAMLQGGTLAIRTALVQVDEAYRLAHNDVSDLYHATGREMRTGPYAVLTVSDTGVGMDAATAARVFEPFFTTKGVGQGTGLGLSMVYGVVRQSDGYIVLSSEPNRGSEFSIFLPAVAPVPSEPVREPAIPLAGSETVLLVEDEVSVRALAAFSLRQNGYHVIDAGDGREALRAAAEYDGPIHLLLTDVVMPGLGGRALAETLRQSRPFTRVLFMSGYPDDEILRRGIQHDRTAFLEKPFTQSVLTAMVRSVLDARVEAAGS